jgi:hypothetical protein
MRCWGAACVILAFLGLSLQPLAAQDDPVPSQPALTPTKLPPKAGSLHKIVSAGAVLLVMESAGGIRAAGTLRNALNSREDLRVVSQADLGRQPLSPAAILTVSAVASQSVSVAYWDLNGTRDWLSAAAPAHADQMDAVVLALASALLDRHRMQLLESSKRVAVEGTLELARTTDALYAVLGRFGRLSPRSNVSLRFEDF